MGIYRGAGGSGDAVNDASSEALITIQARDAALAAQVAAEAAQTAAELAEMNAETAETNAETAETNAETAATNAASSASAASTSASNAASSASAASTSASNASTSASNAASSASAASTSASNASTSATNAANSATSASNSASTATTQATNASNSASAASTSATNAASSATNAASSATAAAGSATNAASSATSASGSASTATTQATNAANSATAAATSATNASNSASAASTSATNASNSASAAATSATNASNSASAASTSASNAATSESNAATSASNAAASYDSFDDRYLGAKSSAPTLDNDGNTLLVGALYFNTSTNEMKVWSGSAWLNAYASLSGALLATNNLSDLNNTATARTNLGVAIGTNVQAWDADLDTWATKTAPSGTVVGTSDSQTLTNKTIALGSNTVSGTLAQFNTAVTDADLASIAGTETLTNKTLTSPTINTATISGGTINNAAIGGTTPAAGSFTSLTDSGNLTFTGTGNRITGDFSNATVANRVMFQSSTTNGNLNAGFLPNGTATQAIVRVYNNSDPTNAAGLDINANSTTASLNSIITGTGTYLPLTMFTGGSERLRIDTSGNVGIGISSPAFKLQVIGTSQLSLSGAGTQQALQLNNSDTTAGTQAVKLGFSSAGVTKASINAAVYGNDYMTFNVGSDTERMRIDSSGNVGIGTSSPSFKLDVNGDTRTTGYYSVNNVGYIRSSSGLLEFQGGSTATRFLDSSYSAELMRITQAGNVGIGTSSPSSRLHVTAPSGSVFTQISSGTNDMYLGYDSVSGMQTVQSDTGLYFATGASFTERMRIDSSGNVGIGTSSPSSYLTGVFTVASSGDNYLNIVSGNANAAGCMFQDTTGTSIVGGTRYTHSDNKIGLWANGSEQFAATSAGLFQFNSGYGSVATAYGCRAWVNFNGTSTVSIRASGNVSSITDNGTGDYTINFSNAMPDANYTLTASAGRGSGGTDPRAVGLNQANPTTSAARITVKFVDGSAGLSDVEYVCCSIFR